MKRLTALLLAVLMLTAIFPAGVFANETTDDFEVVVNDEINFEAVTQTVGAGSQDNTQSADVSLYFARTYALSGDTVTRAAWINEVVELFALDATEDELPDNYYADVTAEHEFYTSIQVATLYGLIDTPAGENFLPDSPASREFVVHTINHMLGFYVAENATYTFNEATAEPAVATYLDDLQVAVDQGWFALSDGNIYPLKNVTSTEANAVISAVKTILEEDAIDENHTDTIKFNDGVKVIEGYEAVQEAERGTLEFLNLTDSIAAGDIIAVYVIAVPSIYKVTSVETADDITTVKGEAMKLSEVVDMDSLDMEGTSEVGLEYFRDDNDGEIIYVFEDGEETQSQEYARLKTLKDNIKIKDIKKSKKIELIPGVEAKVTAKATKLYLNYKITNKKAQITVGGDLEGTVGLDVDAMKAMGSPKSFLIAGADIPGVGNIGIYVVVQLDGSITYTVTTDFKAEVIATKKSIRVPFHVSKPDTSLTAEINAKVGFQAKATLDLIGIVDGKVYTEIGLKAKYTYQSRQMPNDYDVEYCENFERYAYAEAGYSLEVAFKVLGIWDVEVFSKSEEVDLITKDDKICYHMWHRENGIQRMECSFKDSGKYYTPTTSKNYYGNFYNSSSKAYVTGSDGKPTIVQVYYYSLNASNQATITGCNYATSSMAIPKKIDGYEVISIGDGAFAGKTAIQTLTIPEGVTYIGKNAFEGCTNLRDISFPSTLVEIQRFAFNNCTRLLNVELPEGLVKIWNFTFGNCTNLRKVHIPSTLTSVGVYSGTAGPFAGCGRLEQVTWGAGIEVVANNLFASCSGLKQITLPSTVTSINGDAFRDCNNIAVVNFNQGLVNIGDEAFYKCVSIKEVTIPTSVTFIGRSAFEGASALEKINFNEGLVEIQRFAFADCPKLTEVILPKTLTKLWNRSFGNCDGLTKIFVPKSLTSVGIYAGTEGPFAASSNIETVEFESGITKIVYALFSGCDGIKNITIPETVTTIEAKAFLNCDNLTDITFSKNITSIGDDAFKDCAKITKIELPPALTYIGISAFESLPILEEVTFNEGLLEIQRHAFANNPKLTEVILPKTVTKIWNWSFGNCDKLTKVFIPKSLTNVRINSGTEGPFANCALLNDIEFEAGVTNIVYSLFSACDGIKNITIPDTVTTIEARAFLDCDNLTDITFSKNITSIGDSAFEGCAKITKIELPPALTYIGVSAFSSLPLLESVTFNDRLLEIQRLAFANNPKLKEVILPKSLTKIGNWTFGNCDGLTKVFIPKALTNVHIYSGTEGPFASSSNIATVEFEEGIELIAYSLFSGCDSAFDITIPATVKTVSDRAFLDATKMKSVTFAEGSVLTYIGQDAFHHADSITKIALPSTLTGLGRFVFMECDNLAEVEFLGNNISSIPQSAFDRCYKLVKVNIPQSVTNIADYAFVHCQSLTDITLPDGVKYIGQHAFNDCVALAKVEIPTGITTIRTNTFYNCDALKEVIIPDNVITVENSAFEEADGLVKVVVPDSVTAIGEYAFKGCEKLSDVTLGNGISVIAKETFFGSPSLEEIVIPKGVTSISASAFKNNTSLVSVTIPQTVTSIGSEAFSYNDLMTIYGCKGSYAESWATEMGFTFVDITNNLVGFALVDENGEFIDSITVYKGDYFRPNYMTIANDDTKEYTDSFAYTFSSNAVQVSGTQLYARSTGEVNVNVTAVMADGTSNIDPVEFTVNVIDLKSIEVTAPTKTQYAFGEELDLAGMKVNAVYTDGSKKEVDNYTYSGYNPESYGVQTITVEFGGKNATFKVEVVDDRVLVEAIRVEKLPDKVDYLLKESLDTTGIVVIASKNNGLEEEVSTDKLTFSKPNILTAGEKTITVTYAGEDVKDTADPPETTFVVTYYKEIPNVTPEELDTAIEELYNKGVTLEDKAAVEKLVKDYESLTDAAKMEVTNIEKLDKMQYQISGLAAAEELIAAIDELYAKGKDNVTEDEVNHLTSVYNSLAKEFQKTVTNAAKLDTMSSWFVGDVKLGDVNGDNLVNALDATQILRFANGKSSVFAGLSEAERKACGDVNGDGFINALDATQILRHANGKSSVLSK